MEGNYLSKKIEKKFVVYKDIEPLMEKFSVPVFDNNLLVESNKLKVEKDGLKISASFQELSKEFSVKDREVFKGLDENIQNLYLAMESPEDYFELTNFILENENSKLDLFEIASKDTKIYFRFRNFNTIISRSGINSFGSMFSVLHEIGHTVDVEGTVGRLEFSHSKNPNDQVKLTDQQKELILRNERNAWSFALKKIRPFIKDFNVNMDDVDKFIHEVALYGYSDLIKN